jgi:hypothetical protein
MPLRSLSITCITFLSLPAARADQPPTLEFGLGREAAAIVKQLRAKAYRNVGVLKFLLAREGQGRHTDSLGPLNLLLARRLEVALVVKNDPNDPVGVIENASAVAAKVTGASHLSREGLDRLFAADYPLAWGSGMVKPDALIVGDGVLNADLRTLTLGIHLIDAKTRKRQTLTEALVVRLRPEHLAEAGASFHRGAFDREDGDADGKAKGGGVETAEPRRPPDRERPLLDDADKVRQGKRPHPAEDPAAPFVLAVLYDGVEQPVEVRDGEAVVPEPAEGQKVVVRVCRRDRSPRTFGLVVKVNGENTLDRQQLPDEQCRCWLSEAASQDRPLEIKGYQMGKDKLDPFRVASRAESKQREVHYGSDVGTVSLTVYAERRGKKAPRPLDYDEKDERLIARSELPRAKEKPDTFARLQQDLYAGLDRGLIVEGGQLVEEKVEVVRFERDPTPVMSITLRYYRK